MCNHCCSPILNCSSLDGYAALNESWPGSTRSAWMIIWQQTRGCPRSAKSNKFPYSFYFIHATCAVTVSLHHGYVWVSDLLDTISPAPHPGKEDTDRHSEQSHSASSAVQGEMNSQQSPCWNLIFRRIINKTRNPLHQNPKGNIVILTSFANGVTIFVKSQSHFKFVDLRASRLRGNDGI